MSSLTNHFTVLCSVTWPLNGSEAGGDLALIQTSLLYVERFSIDCGKTKTKQINYQLHYSGQSRTTVKPKPNYFPHSIGHFRHSAEVPKRGMLFKFSLIVKTQISEMNKHVIQFPLFVSSRLQLNLNVSKIV